MSTINGDIRERPRAASATVISDRCYNHFRAGFLSFRAPHGGSLRFIRGTERPRAAAAARRTGRSPFSFLSFTVSLRPSRRIISLACAHACVSLTTHLPVRLLLSYFPDLLSLLSFSLFSPVSLFLSLESSTLQSGAATYTTRWIPSPGSRARARRGTEHARRSDNDRGYSRSGFYFLPSPVFVCAREPQRPRPISSRRPRVCRFIVSRPIRDNCCWSVPDVCTERDAKSFFPYACVAARARARGSDTRLPSRRGCFITCEIFLRPHAHIHHTRAHAYTCNTVISGLVSSRLLERASFIVVAVNARADRRGDLVNWNVACSIKLLK